MFADINYMKLINDDYGHLNGDLAIKATAEALRAAMPDDWLFGRYGGDEFIAVGHCKDEAMAEVLKQKFTDILKNIVTVQRISFTLTASIGYTIIKPDDGSSIAEFINRADESMYREKQRAHEEIRKARESGK